jgi:hypothetical protein
MARILTNDGEIKTVGPTSIAPWKLQSPNGAYNPAFEIENDGDASLNQGDLYVDAGDLYLEGDDFPQFRRGVEFMAATPQEHFRNGTDDISWTGWAAYTGFVTPSYQLYGPSWVRLGHSVIAKGFKYRSIPAAAANYLFVRAVNTFYAYGGVMVDDGSDKGDGTGANNFLNVCMYSPAPAGTAPYMVTRYRTGGGAVTTTAFTNAVVPIGQFSAFGMVYGFTTPWTSWSWGAYVMTEAGNAGLVHWPGGTHTWTPTRQGLYWESISNGTDKGAQFDWFREI